MTGIKDKEEIWEWWKIFCDFESSQLSPAQFCNDNNIDYKKFMNFKNRFQWKAKLKPDYYKKMVQYVHLQNESKEPVGDFCKKHRINPEYLGACKTHLKYLGIIKELQSKKETGTMNFVQLPSVETVDKPIQKPEDKGEYIEKQNDIEIIISKGVKVSIAPNIESTKVIKIIELLKDL